jgi:hypothetical protein
VRAVRVDRSRSDRTGRISPRLRVLSLEDP